MSGTGYVGVGISILAADIILFVLYQLFLGYYMKTFRETWKKL